MVSNSDNVAVWLCLWTANNVAVTILNKIAFSKVDFHYPYLLSALHMFCNTIGSQTIFHLIHSYKTNNKAYSALSDEENGFDNVSVQYPGKSGIKSTIGAGIYNILGNIERKSIDTREKRAKIVGFSVIFSLNIAIGNVSLRHVNVNFNQVMRSLVPALTILMGEFLGKNTSFQRKVAVLPIVAGVACACYGDMTYTKIGFFYTCCCIFLAALKVVAAGEMLTGQTKLHPVDLLSHMAPLAFVQCLVLSILSGEISTFLSKPQLPAKDMFVVLATGVLSFSLNISSLQANKLTSPLTLCIAANVKQVSMIALATIIFSIPISVMNATGIVIVLIGSSIYSYISVLEKTNVIDKVSSHSLQLRSYSSNDLRDKAIRKEQST